MSLLWSPAAREQRLLTETDVVRAHIAAPHLLQAWQSHDAHYWRRVSIGWFVGAPVPLLGYFLLQWPLLTILLAMLFDVLALWTCDASKFLLAGDRVRQEQDHLDEAAEVRAVIQALKRPTRPIMGRDLFAPTPKPAYHVSLPERHRDVARMNWIAASAAICLVLLLLAALRWLVDLQGFLLLLAGLLARVGWSIRSTLRARDAAGSRPELLPESLLPTLALVWVFPLTAMLASMLQTLGMRIRGPDDLALPVLVLHLLMMVLMAWIGLRNVRQWVRALRSFAAQDRTRLRARVRHVNGTPASPDGSPRDE